MRLLFRFKKYLPLILLFLVEVLLFVTNYKHGTYFLGWDNLAPELNLPENLRRSFFGIWQEYRGLGLLDGMSFAANLPHYLFIGLLSIVFPQSILRYIFIFLMHFLGGVGMYLLIGELLQEYAYKKVAAFFGGLFYLLNLATVQMFFIPYEVFTVHFAALPMLLFFIIKYLKTGSKKNLLWLIGVTLFSIPQGHVPTLFIVYSFALFAVLGFYLVQERKVVFKRSVIVLLLTFFLNAFWAVPYAYSTVQNASIIANSKINQMGTEDVFRRNQAFGDLLDVVLLKGFALDFMDIKAPGISGYMMEEWRNYANSPLFIITGIGIFLIAFFAGIKAVITKKKRFYPFILLFVFSFLMLGTTIPILSIVSLFFYKYIPYFFQIFRFTFTKFSILYAFSFSILFAFGVLSIFQFFDKNKYMKYLSTFVLFALIVCSSYLSFSGQFLYPGLKNSIPQEYFTMINYFKTKDHNTRIALLPQPSYWGWTYNQWGYRGSGFIWYGLPQASLDGAFYPWSRLNENYYWEMTYAIYSGNADLLDSVLEKYQVNWIVVDHSIITQFSPKSLYLDQLEVLLKQSKQAHIAKSFGKINIYQVDFNHNTQSFVTLTNNLPIIHPDYQANNLDQAYRDVGMYRSESAQPYQKASDSYYPFRSLFTGKTQQEHEFALKETKDSYSFEFQIPKGINNAFVAIPPINSQDIQEIDPNNPTPSTLKTPEIRIGSALFSPAIYTNVNIPSEGFHTYNVKSGETVKISIPKINGYMSYSSRALDDLFTRKAYSCINTKGSSGFKTEQVKKEKIVQLESINTDLCYDIYLPNLSQRLAYLISISTRTESGRPLIFWLENQNSRRSDIETYLSNSKFFTSNYFIQPPMEYYGLGYTIHLQNHAVGQEQTINQINSIEMHPFPYTFLTGVKVVNTQLHTQQIIYNNFAVQHPNPSVYYINLKDEKNAPNTIVLSQSYHPAWKAYVVSKRNIFTDLFPFVGNKELKNHFVVNNWANGWELDEQGQKGISTIELVFWPQWLEYFGFVLLPVPFIYVFWPQKKNKKKENID